MEVQSYEDFHKSLKKWIDVDVGEGVFLVTHRFPKEDMAYHQESHYCPCKPEMYLMTTKGIVKVERYLFHNSFEAEEMREQGYPVEDISFDDDLPEGYDARFFTSREQ